MAKWTVELRIGEGDEKEEGGGGRICMAKGSGAQSCCGKVLQCSLCCFVAKRLWVNGINVLQPQIWRGRKRGRDRRGPVMRSSEQNTGTPYRRDDEQRTLYADARS